MISGKLDQIIAQVEKMRPMPVSVTRILKALMKIRTIQPA